MAKKRKNDSLGTKPRVYRDSETGRFVTRKYAKKHRKSTLRAW